MHGMGGVKIDVLTQKSGIVKRILVQRTMREKTLVKGPVAEDKVNKRLEVHSLVVK